MPIKSAPKVVAIEGIMPDRPSGAAPGGAPPAGIYPGEAAAGDDIPSGCDVIDGRTDFSRRLSFKYVHSL
jgi:hypothetical protein